MEASTSKNVYLTPDSVFREGPPASLDYSTFAGSSQPLVIDNGASEVRAGWASELEPRIVCENLVSKYRERKNNKSILLAGGEVYADNTSKANVKSPYDGDIVCNFDVMENMLDYLFAKLAINAERIDHPILMTETVGNPLQSRSLMSELLFEGYGVPAVTYGIDSLFDFYGSGHSSGLVVSSSTSSSHVLPVVGGKGILAHSRKLAWGGSQASDYLLKLVQLKYPAFPLRVASSQTSALLQEHCYFSEDYTSELRSLSDPRNIAKITHTIQFPFTALVSDEKSEEELARIAEKRREAGRRLQEQSARQRLEKLVQTEQNLVSFKELKAFKGKEKKADFNKRLTNEGFDSEAELDESIKKAEQAVKRARNKDLGIDEEEEKGPPSFPLVDVPDHQLNEEDLKEKRKQRLMKANYDARMRAKAEKEAEKLRLVEEARKDEEARSADPQAWLANVRRQHEELLESIKERQKRKAALSDRKSAAAQQRMKSIASLASDSPASKKRRKGKDDDNFGAKDEDWAVYRQIGGADDSEEEEEVQSALKGVEKQLLEHDPSFTLDDTAERRSLRKHHLLNAFVRGMAPDDPLSSHDPENPEHTSRLHLNIERLRAVEPLFQPSMAGVDQAGMAELVEHVFKQFNAADRERLASRVFITGGNTLLPGFDHRIRTAIQSILPVGTTLNVEQSRDRVGAWRGMAQWARNPEFASTVVSKAEYDEYGGEYIKEHRFSNGYIHT